MKKNYIKTRFATYSLATMMAISVVNLPVVSNWRVPMATVHAASYEADDEKTNEVEFGDAEDWDTWNNTLKAEFEGDGEKIAKDSTITFTMTIDADEYSSLGENGHIKVQNVFFNEIDNWDTVVKLGWPIYKKDNFVDNGNDTYSVDVSMTFGEAVDSFQKVLFQAVGTNFKGDVEISDLTIAPPEEMPVLEPAEPIVVATFDEGIGDWKGEAGWDYSHGKDDPAKNDDKPSEPIDVEWDEESKSMKLILDYSKDTASGWSEAKATGTFEPVNLSKYNMVTFKLKYPSDMENVKTKLFMLDAGSNEILNQDGSFRTKTVEDLGDGWSVATVRGEFKPKNTKVSSLTIGIVGPYANLTNVYIDDITFGQLDDSEDYVDITEVVKEDIDTVDLSKMPESVKLVDSNATDSAKALAAYLSGLQKDDKVLLGHQNSTFRSVCDNGITSDIYDITGSEAGLFGIDTLALAGCEASSENPMQASIEATKKAYEGGSIITLSCHMPNFTNSKIKATGDANHPFDFSKCDFYESKDLTPCADYILEGGTYNAQFNAYLDIIAEYALTMQEEDVPILFRPFHENSGGWFWWGTSTSADSYKAMWRYMVDYLQEKGVHNLLYVYSPNGPISSEADYLSRYPGDAYVDVLGFDYYDDYADVNKYTGDIYLDALASSCDVVASLAKSKNKIPAIAEAGIRITGAGKDSLMVADNPTKDKDWYNNIINTAVAHDIPYFLLWANFDSSNFFVPYKFNDKMGQEMINDFIKSYNNEKSIFGNGTNFYGNEGAISKAANITLEGYSDDLRGYMVSPRNNDVIKSECEFKATVKNAAKVEFVIKTSADDANPLILNATKSATNDVYTAKLTNENLASIGKTGTGIVSVIAYSTNDTTGKELGVAQYICFNQDAAKMPANVFDDFEYYYGNDGLLQVKYGSHNSASGCMSSFTLDDKNKVQGNYAGSFNYTLSYKGSEVWTGGLGRNFEEKDFSAYNAISMWVKPDGNGQKMVMQLRDSNGKEYEAYLSEFVKGTKAQYVTIPFTSFIVKGGDSSINPNDIAGCYFWCNSIPDNVDDSLKDEKGNYKVSGSIVFDDIKAIKLSDADLKKVGNNGLIVSETPLENLAKDDNSGNEKKPANEENKDAKKDAKKDDKTDEKTDVSKPAKVKNLSLTKKSATKVQITWDKVSGANGYQIYMKTDNKNYKLIKTITKAGTVSFVKTGLKKGKNYSFKVRAYKLDASKNKLTGEYSSDKSIVLITPKAASLSKLTAKAKAFEIKWKKVKAVDGYQIQYSTDSDFDKSTIKTISKNKTKYTVKKLKAKKKYYVRIRTYKNVKVNNKLQKAYSLWSAKKTVKTKK